MNENVGPFSHVLDCAARPKAYFADMAKDLGWAAPLARVEAWGLLAAFTGLAVAEQGQVLGPALHDPARLAGFALKVLLYQPIAALITAACFHLAAKLLGGTASFQASFRVAAALTIFAPLVELLRLVEFYGLALACGGMLWYWSQAWIGVHAVAPKRSYALFGILAAGLAGLTAWNAAIS